MLNGAAYDDPRKFLQTHEYKNLTRWTKESASARPSSAGAWSTAPAAPEEQLHERHDASDFETKTQDKLQAAEAS